MKKTLIALIAAGALTGCTTEMDKNKVGAALFGAGAVAICAQSGVCAFPL